MCVRVCVCARRISLVTHEKGHIFESTSYRVSEHCCFPLQSFEVKMLPCVSLVRDRLREFVCGRQENPLPFRVGTYGPTNFIFGFGEDALVWVYVCVVGKGTAFFFPLQSFEVKTLPYVSAVRDRW